MSHAQATIAPAGRPLDRRIERLIATALRIGIERIERWLFDEAFPFWADTGVDRAGPGFVEHLTLDGGPANVPFKRVRVQARQVYCFCQAAELGWSGNPIGLAERGVDLLIGTAWGGPARGWASTLTRSGAVLDGTPDLYDIAFVLFALGAWHRVTGDRRVPHLCGQTLDFLDARMRHPSGEGYRHRLGGTAPHLQNPHMHLAEAMIVLRDTTGHMRFAREADRLVDLALRRFYDPASGTLAEQFADDWSPQAGPHGIALEPGHHDEWTWLLHRHLGPDEPEGSPAREAMRRLSGFAVRNGRDPATGLVRGSVLSDGTPLDADHRLWPQAEHCKAQLALFERDGTDTRPTIAAGITRLFDHYLTAPRPGTWVEYRDPQLKPKGDKIPASSFYHVVLAFAEVLRLRSALTDLPA